MLSNNTKETIKYYRYLHEEKVKWDAAFEELRVDRQRRKLKILMFDLLQSMNGTFMVDYDSDVTSSVGLHVT